MQDLVISNERLKAQANEKDRLISLYTKSDYSVIWAAQKVKTFFYFPVFILRFFLS